MASGSEADDLWEFDTASLSSVGASDEGGEYDDTSLPAPADSETFR